jgi:hypothetical protein
MLRRAVYLLGEGLDRASPSRTKLSADEAAPLQESGLTLSTRLHRSPIWPAGGRKRASGALIARVSVPAFRRLHDRLAVPSFEPTGSGEHAGRP